MNTIRNSANVVGFLYAILGIVDVLNLSYVPADPSHTVLIWLVMSSMLEGLVSRMEILGGLWVLLFTWKTWRVGRLPLRLNALGVVTGVAGILTVIPALQVLGIGFELGEMVWIMWLGIIFIQAQRHNNRLRSYRAILDFGIQRCLKVLKRTAHTRLLPPLLISHIGEKS